MKGWVYVISNPAMPSIVKIGYSSKDPKLRAEELYTTGVPRPFEVNYSLLVDNPYALEQHVHKSLKHINDGKEWFKCSAEEAIATIRDIHNGSIYFEEYHNVDRERTEHRIAQENEQKNFGVVVLALALFVLILFGLCSHLSNKVETGKMKENEACEAWSKGMNEHADVAARLHAAIYYNAYCKK